MVANMFSMEQQLSAGSQLRMMPLTRSSKSVFTQPSSSTSCELCRKRPRDNKSKRFCWSLVTAQWKRYVTDFLLLAVAKGLL